MVIFPFYVTVIEENINKFFYLGVFNGVSEGNLIACIVIHSFGFFGISFIEQNGQIFNYTIYFKDLFVYFFFSWGLLIFAFQFYNLFKKHWNVKWVLLSRFKCFFYLVFTMSLLCFCAPDSIIITNYPKIPILSHGCNFSILAAKVMLKTFTLQEDFEQDSISSNTYYFLCILGILVRPFIGVTFLDVILFVGFFYNFFALMMFLYKLAFEVANILKVNILTIESIDKKKN